MSLQINNVCPVPPTLDVPEVIYKYREINEFLFRSLLLNQVWLAKPASFNDPFEPERIFSGSNFSRALSREIQESGVLCLCKSNTNLPMWSYYGGGLRGLAIGYDTEKLLSTLKPANPSKNECTPRWKYVYDLDYNDDDLSEIDESSLRQGGNLKAIELQKMFATKSHAYSHENECRIIVPPSPDSRDEFAWSGFGLYQHDRSAIREVVFGELMSSQDRQAVIKILTDCNIQFFEATRSKQRFEITISPL